MMDKTIQISTSTTTSTPSNLKFGELALSSIGSADKLFIGNSSQVPSEIVLKNNVKNITWKINSNQGGSQVYNGTNILLYGNNNAKFFNVENCSITSQATIFNPSNSRFTIPLTGTYIITVSGYYNLMILGSSTNWRILFTSPSTPSSTNNYHIPIVPSPTSTPTTSGNTAFTLTITKYCNANDYFVVSQDAGNIGILMSAEHNYVIITYLGE